MAGREIERVHAGENGAQNGNTQKQQSGIAQRGLNGASGGPGGSGGQHGSPRRDHSGTEDEDCIDACTAHDRSQHQPKRGFVGEMVLLGRQRDAVKADKTIGGVADNGDDAGKRRFLAEFAVNHFCEKGLQVGGDIRLCHQNADEAENNSSCQCHCDGGLEPAGRLYAPYIHVSQNEDERGGQQNFAQIDLPTCQGIEIAELEDAGQQIPRGDADGDGVQRNQRPVSQHHHPAAGEGVFLAEGSIGINEFAAG